MRDCGGFFCFLCLVVVGGCVDVVLGWVVVCLDVVCVVGEVYVDCLGGCLFFDVVLCGCVVYVLVFYVDGVVDFVCDECFVLFGGLLFCDGV